MRGIYVNDLDEPIIDADNVALIVVDMQEYFCRPDSRLAKVIQLMTPDGGRAYQDRLADIVIPNTLALLEWFRNKHKFVGFTEFGAYTADALDLPAWARSVNEMSKELIGDICLLPLVDPSLRVISEFSPRVGEFVFQKSTSGPLAGTSLAQALRSVGVDWVIVTGVCSDICVLGAARELADVGFKTIVAEDAAAAALGGDPQHKAALDILRGSFSDVLTTKQVLAALSRSGPPWRADQPA